MQKTMILILIALLLVGCGRWRKDDSTNVEADELIEQIDRLESTVDSLDDIDEDLVVDEESGVQVDSLLNVIDQLVTVFNSLDEIRDEEISQP
ncbi:MAG: hypothetical protein Q8O35_06700 [Humidesulfovibrio sp.]|uniref:hypothetical protein n=1 Tax=Humidesulfovibrio sp. TaxID=2910988 RepID=UPI002734C722|nr:hypothetical protein [Humidesulfovibrio sp.]MDP2847867.1 hypothetical protein [Humidesulfovibrio sp.]